MLSQFFAKKIKRHPSNEVDLAFSQCKNARRIFFQAHRNLHCFRPVLVSLKYTFGSMEA